MIKANHKKLWVKFFDLYIPYILSKDFKSINLQGYGSFGKFCEPRVKKEKAALVLSNHFSWWDGFFIYYLNQKVLRKKFHVMMLEEELSKRRIFSNAGAYSIKKQSRGIIESLRYTSEILTDPGNMILLFPQGEIQSSHTAYIKFEKGIAKVLENMPPLSEIIFCQNFTEYFSNRKPELFTFYQRFDGKRNLPEAEKAFNEFYDENLNRLGKKDKT